MQIYTWGGVHACMHVHIKTNILCVSYILKTQIFTLKKKISFTDLQINIKI